MSTKKRKRSRKPKRRRPVGAAVHQMHTRRLEKRAADAFYEDGDEEKALELFQQAEAIGPLSDSGLEAYLDVVHTLRDFDQYARIALTIVDRYPNDPKANLLAGSACYATQQPVSAIVYWEKLIKLAPQHPGTITASEELTKLRKHLPEILDAFVDDLPKELPRVASVENILHFLKLGRFDDVVRRCRKHLQRYPDDIRIRNNLAEALSLRGNQTEALQILNETIERAPNNFYAHAARSRLLYFMNRKADSESDAQKLRTLQPKQVSDLTKAAQAFAFRGDDQGIAWSYQQAEQNDWLRDKSTDVALLLHYQATQLARVGEPKAAKPLWKRADKIAGHSVPAAENLLDLRQPIGEGSGPFFFHLTDWLNGRQQADMRSIVGAIHDELDDAASFLSDRLGGFLRQHRELEHLLPDMLDRGDQAVMQFAVRMARQSRRDDVKSALKSFALGTRGTDTLRFEIASNLYREGAFDSDTIEIYVRGKPDRVAFLDFEITDEPTIPKGRDDLMQQQIEKAINHLHRREGAQAEELLLEAMQVEPNAPDLKNNLAMALQLQNRMEEANRLVDELIEQHPDYFFAQIARANRAVQAEDFDRALETLTQLQRRKVLHGTEFVALARSMVYAYVGRGALSTAQRWLSMLRDYDPENPAVDQLRRHIEFNRVGRDILSLMRWR